MWISMITSRCVLKLHLCVNGVAFTTRSIYSCSWGATLRHLTECLRWPQRALLCLARLWTACCICEIWGLFRSQLRGLPSQSCVVFTTHMEPGFIKDSRGPSSNFWSPFTEKFSHLLHNSLQVISSYFPNCEMCLLIKVRPLVLQKLPPSRKLRHSEAASHLSCCHRSQFHTVFWWWLRQSLNMLNPVFQLFTLEEVQFLFLRYGLKTL